MLPFKRFRTREARSSTRCSAPRCARPARSWASTPTSRARSRRVRMPPTAGCPVGNGVRVVSPTATSVRSCCRSCGYPARIRHRRDRGTAEVLARNGIPATTVRKYFMGQATRRRRSVDRRTHQCGQDRCRDQHPVGTQRSRRQLRDPHRDGGGRQAAVHDDRAVGAAVASFEVARGEMRVRSLQDYAKDRAASLAASELAASGWASR